MNNKIVNNNMKKVLTLLSLSILVGCSSSNYGDLDSWMKSQTVLQKGSIQPLPPEKKFELVEFNAIKDPFNEVMIITETTTNANPNLNKNAPDEFRRKEPLEKYPLSMLMMVGIIDLNKETFALIKTPEGIINYVTLGNYLGVNHGKIIAIEEKEVTLEEKIIGGTEGWNIITTKVPLVDESQQSSSK